MKKILVITFSLLLMIGFMPSKADAYRAVILVDGNCYFFSYTFDSAGNITGDFLYQITPLQTGQSKCTEPVNGMIKALPPQPAKISKDAVIGTMNFESAVSLKAK